MSEQASNFLLHDAARRGDANAKTASQAEGLIKSHPRYASVKDADGRLPIHWAASANSVDVVRLLVGLPDFDPDIQDDSGWSPFMIAANIKDSEEILSILLAKGADINQRNHNGQVNQFPGLCYVAVCSPAANGTALHLIASKGNTELAHILFQQQPPVSSRVRDRRGQYPIHRAAAAGSTPMIKLLLSHKSPIDATDVSGYTPFHHAVAEGHGDAAVTLMKAGADTRKRDVDGMLAIQLSPDKEIRRYIEREAEREGIEI
ncbi:hypothetical protein jhhlp_006460 [Lomentospora prolificans]|uniref:Uncharacterized protein n=1 Tax=Lomentospora prolificans TaxID=41688 RepID=A0A2N3N649_9PEZI|nr:hypothetical protein jhhlp_006460 [Lomentospora prolificans]